MNKGQLISHGKHLLNQTRELLKHFRNAKAAEKPALIEKAKELLAELATNLDQLKAAGVIGSHEHFALHGMNSTVKALAAGLADETDGLNDLLYHLLDGTLSAAVSVASMMKEE